MNIIECNAGNQTAGMCNEVVGSPNLNGILGYGNTVVFSDYGYVVATWSVYTLVPAFHCRGSRLTTASSSCSPSLVVRPACLCRKPPLISVAHVAIAVKTRHWWALWTLALGCASECPIPCWHVWPLTGSRSDRGEPRFCQRTGCIRLTVQWGGRVLSVQTLAWNENLGGWYVYDFNGFIMQ